MPARTRKWPAGGRRLAAHAEALARSLAPDVATGPFYVVLRPDLPAEYHGGDGGPLALTSRHLDLMLQPTLERQRRWRGRGPAILLGPVAIAADAGYRPQPTRRRVFPAVAMIELRAQAAALRERGELVKQADREEEAARRMAEGIVPGSRTTRIDEMRERSARARKVGQEALAALSAVQDEIAKVEREEEAVYERMAKP